MKASMGSWGAGVKNDGKKRVVRSLQSNSLARMW